MPHRTFRILSCLSCLLLPYVLQAQSFSLGQAEVILPTAASTQQQTAARMLVEEVQRRSSLVWTLEQKPSGTKTAVLLLRSQTPQKPESFSIRTHAQAGPLRPATIEISGAD